MSLQSRIINASSWVFGGHLISQLIRMTGNLIMTRLLVPEMFGVMAIANVLLVGLALFSDLGFQQNIIQSNRGNDPIFLNTVWTLQIIRGLIIWLMALILAFIFNMMSNYDLWPTNSVYNDPILPNVICVITLNAVISGFESTKIASANRELSLGIVTRIQLVSQIVGFITMVTWALVDKSIWALIMGSIVANIVRVSLSHISVPGKRNSLILDWESFKQIFQFGRWIFLTSIFGFMVNNGDRILLGGLIDKNILGFYVIAFFIVDSVQQILQKIMASVIFPALSEVVRENNKSVCKAYYKMRLPIDIISLISAGIFFSCGNLIVQILYDERYLQAGNMLQILSIMLIGIRYNVAGKLFIAIGKPNLLVPIILARLLPLYTLIPAFYSWFGLDGALLIAGGSVLFSLPIIFYFKFKYFIFDLKHEIKSLIFLLLGYILGLAINFFSEFAKSLT